MVVPHTTGHGGTVMTQTMREGPPRAAAVGRRGRVLLERDAALDTLDAAVRRAAGGRGSAVLVTGEAGIGKTTLVREFIERTGGRVKVLGGGCDNLVTPRPLGPLRDAAAGSGGKLETALRAGRTDGVYPAVVEELSWPAPNVLLVEDLHWVDDATVDVLAYLARRLEGLPAVLVLTYRDDSVPAEHPARRLLGALAGGAGGPVAARAAVRRRGASSWSGLRSNGPGRPGAARAQRRQPVLRHRGAGRARGPQVPITVADAVLARLRRLRPHCRDAVEQLSVVPTPVDFELAEALLGGRLDALTEAEDTGILRVRAGGLVFRHELARRAVEQSLSGLRRRRLHAAVVAALRAAPEPQLARLVHHATQAGDGATVSRFAPQAGREAVAAGSHRQALAHFAAALRHAHRLEPAELARVVDEYAWELYNAHRYARGAGRGGTGDRAVPRAGRPARAGRGAGPAVPAPLHGRRHVRRRARGRGGAGAARGRRPRADRSGRGRPTPPPTTGRCSR